MRANPGRAPWILQVERGHWKRPSMERQSWFPINSRRWHRAYFVPGGCVTPSWELARESRLPHLCWDEAPSCHSGMTLSTSWFHLLRMLWIGNPLLGWAFSYFGFLYGVFSVKVSTRRVQTRFSQIPTSIPREFEPMLGDIIMLIVYETL